MAKTLLRGIEHEVECSSYLSLHSEPPKLLALNSNLFSVIVVWDDGPDEQCLFRVCHAVAVRC